MMLSAIAVVTESFHSVLYLLFIDAKYRISELLLTIGHAYDVCAFHLICCLHVSLLHFKMTHEIITFH